MLRTCRILAAALSLALALLAAPAWAGEPPRGMERAKGLSLALAEIEGVVTKARRFPRRHRVRLEFGGLSEAPRSAPTVAFVRGENLLEITGQPTARDATDWLRGLVGKRVRVEGKVELYRGRPQIVVSAREQSAVLE